MAAEIKLFGKWAFDDVQVNDISLEDYIAVKSKYAVYVPHSAGRYQSKRFRKAQCPIVERLTNALMMHGRNNGKKLMAVRIVKHAMDIINLLTDQNPIQVRLGAPRGVQGALGCLGCEAGPAAGRAGLGGGAGGPLSAGHSPRVPLPSCVWVPGDRRRHH